MNSNSRSSNFEMLRILAMLQIIAFHLAFHSNFLFIGTTVTFNRVWYQMLFMGGKLGVNLFVMITGYFMVSAKGIKTANIIRLWGQTLFYVLLFYFLMPGYNGNGMTQDKPIGKFFPISSDQYWFISCYLALYILIPFINQLLTSVDKDLYRRMLIVVGIIWVLIPNISWIPGLAVTTFNGSNLAFFIYMYSLAAYFRLYSEDFKGKPVRYFLGDVALLAVTAVTVLVLDVIGKNSPAAVRLIPYLYNYQYSLLTVLRSILLFLCFKNIRMKESKIINVLASCTLGIYMLHDNWQFRRTFWNQILNTPSHAQDKLFALYTLGLILAVFIVGFILEFIRKNTIERLFMLLVNKVSPGIDKTFDKFVSLFKNKSEREALSEGNPEQPNNN